VQHAVPNVPVLAGSGVTPDSVGEILALADGVIVGTTLKRDGITANEVDRSRVLELVARARGA
jgi:uncharacterized protein